ncbi:MAG: glucokinase [Nitrospirales bacterium]|nr:glucokinase [Nitrospira sp.]MDR4500566.1 glucokinase [Nitrospirales bacterium]
MILAGDIGATKTLLALFDWTDERVEPIREDSFWSQDYESLEDILSEFLDQDEMAVPPELEEDGANSQDSPVSSPRLSGSEIRASLTTACFGVPGPVIDNACKTTNLPWLLKGETLAEHLQVKTVRLVNDLEATGHGLLVLRPDELESLTPTIPRMETGTRSLLAAGSGLGEVTLFWDGIRYHMCPSEGGHTDFGPNSDREIELLRYLRTSYLHVSYERVLSGPGLHTIYQFLRDTQKNEPTWFAEKLPTGNPSALISEAALAGKPEICVDALKLFVSIYGAEASNMALKTLSYGGVYLGGGIAPKILPFLRDGVFMKAFMAKGRYKRLLSKIPVQVILNPQAALLGAASLAAQLANKA